MRMIAIWKWIFGVVQAKAEVFSDDKFHASHAKLSVVDSIVE